ncbi:MAG: mechanosensitive ion channel family protein [Halanaerobiaceae bacterium]
MDLSVFHNVGSDFLSYMISFFILLLGVLLVHFLVPLLIDRIFLIMKQDESELQKMFRSRTTPLLYLLIIHLALINIEIPGRIQGYFNTVTLILLFFFGTLLLQGIIIFFFRRHWKMSEQTPEQSKVLHLSIFFVRVFIWLLAVVFLLDNLDIQLTGLLAGLGIGGIAIGFAAQSVLNDIFSYFTIFFDNPFDIGDFVTVGPDRGIIEHIGLKTTRIRSLGGEQLVISNTELMNSRINNYKRMEKRRIIFSFGVIYDTEVEKLEIIPGLVEDIICDLGNTEFDRAHFAEFKDFSLEFQVAYYVLSNDYKVYMDIQEEINLRLKREFMERGINFAYPTQTVYVNRKGKGEEE